MGKTSDRCGSVSSHTRRFWPERSDRTWLVIGIVQAIFGVYVYIERFHMSGH